MPRLYNFKPDTHYGFYTGTAKHGNQYIINTYEDSLLTVEFSSDGTYLGYELEESPVRPMYQNDYMQMLKPKLSKLKLQIKPVAIQEFFIQVLEVGTQDLPTILIEYLQDKEAFTENEQKNFKEEIDLWDETQSYVFYWENDWWVSSDGTITSS